MTARTTLYGLEIGIEAIERLVELLTRYGLEYLREMGKEGSPNVYWPEYQKVLVEHDSGETPYSALVEVRSITRDGRTLEYPRGDWMAGGSSLELLRAPWESCTVRVSSLYGGGMVDVADYRSFVTVEVTSGDVDESKLLDEVESILREFPTHDLPNIQQLPPFQVVMGHGGSDEWLKLHHRLQSHYGFAIQEFDSEPMAARQVQPRLETMAATSSAAIVVLTRYFSIAEDKSLPRVNVLHEVGYFQASIGWDRTLVLIEEGIDWPSNLDGTIVIPFKSNQILSAVDPVVSRLNAIKGELGNT